MCERGRTNGIKDTFYRDYTASSSPLQSGEQTRGRVNAGTERRGTRHLAAVEVIQNHSLVRFLMSPPVQLPLLIIQFPPHPHPQRSCPEAKQRQTSLQDHVGSMGAWGERKVESKNGNTQTATNFWACWRTQEDLENGWEEKKEWEICDILIREKKEGAADLETPAFWSQRPFSFFLNGSVPQPIVQVVSSFLSEALFCVFTLSPSFLLC